VRLAAARKRSGKGRVKRPGRAQPTAGWATAEVYGKRQGKGGCMQSGKGGVAKPALSAAS
jgi:hypothetical protein